MISKIIGSKFNYFRIGKTFASVERPLGRWKTETDHKTNLKIDWANEDHCGICSEYLEKSLKNIDTDNFDINKINPIDTKKIINESEPQLIKKNNLIKFFIS